MNTIFPPLLETLYAGCLKFFAAASELFTHAVFQLVFRKTAFSGCIFHEAKNMEPEGAKLGLYGENDGEQIEDADC